MRIEPLIEQDVLRRRVRELAACLRRELGDARPIVLCVAEQSQRFADDLDREGATTGGAADRVLVHAHRPGGQPEGPIAISGIDPDSLEAREVLVLMVRAEAGVVRGVRELIALGPPRQCRVCALLAPETAQGPALGLDWVGFAVADTLVLGYGLEVDGEYAELDWIGALRDDRF